MASAREQRNSQRMLTDIAEVLPRERQQPTLKSEPARGAIPAARGVAERNYQPGSGAGGGITGPLVEGLTAPEGGAATDPQLARTYHPAQTFSTSDGLFTFEHEAIAQVQMRDGAGNPLQVKLADPGA
jgi:hypothetical protein